jgi:hypothetical protein
MVINIAIGGSFPPASLGTGGADYPVVNKTDTSSSDIGSPAPVPGANKTSDVPSEEKRYEAVFQASEDFFKDVYAVSDTSFTIFKDASGQYITRYTSLRDGKVTYVPEQSILQYAQSRSFGNAAILKIQV